MINSIKARTPILALILFVFAVGYTVAAKVVVIPLGVDAVPQSFAVFASGDQIKQIFSDPKAMRTVSLTAPFNGKVIVNSTVLVSHIDPEAIIHCSLNSTSKLFIPKVDITHEQVWVSPGGGLTGTGQLAGTRGFNVTSGRTYYFRLICGHANIVSSSAAHAFDSSLTAIFTPSA